MNRTTVTREAWLEGLVEALRPLFARHKASLPKKVRVTCGWTSKGAKAARIGECWAGQTAADGLAHIYVSPTQSDSLAVAAIIVHELIHAQLGAGAGHGKEFGRIARRVGLEGPLRATHAGPELVETLKVLISKDHLDGGLGCYPHAQVQVGGGPTKTQTTRMLKLECPSDGYSVRTTAKWIEVGLPTCPCGEELEVAA